MDYIKETVTLNLYKEHRCESDMTLYKWGVTCHYNYKEELKDPLKSTLKKDDDINGYKPVVNKPKI